MVRFVSIQSSVPARLACLYTPRSLLQIQCNTSFIRLGNVGWIRILVDKYTLSTSIKCK